MVNAPGLDNHRTAPAIGAVAITASDSTDLAQPIRGIYVGTSSSGTLHVLMRNGDEVTFKNVTQGVLYSLEVKRVFTDSTATDLIGVY